MTELTRALRFGLLGLGLLALILTPFLLWGEAVEAWVRAHFGTGSSDGAVAALVVGLLSADIVLPLPSSLIAAGAGMRLGLSAGVVVIFAGLMIGNSVGFVLGRRFGAPAAAWAGGGEPRLPSTIGMGMLFLTRAVPVLSEAATVVAGAGRLPFSQFALAAGLANLGIALCYGWLGALARDTGSFLLVFAASVAVPAVAYALWLVAVGRGLPARD